MSEIKSYSDRMGNSNECLIEIPEGENEENELAYIGYISKWIKIVI